MIETNEGPIAPEMLLSAAELRERYPYGRYGDQPVPAGVELLDPVWRAAGALAVVRADSGLQAVHCFGMDVVPELLQTGGYCGALMHLYDPSTPAKSVGLLVDPEFLFSATGSLPVFSFVIDEAVLRRPVGGREVMAEQLRHLLACAALPHVTVQVMPSGNGCHLALTRPTLICVGLQDTWVYVEGAYGAMWLPDLTLAVPLVEAYHRMRTHALPPAASAELIRQAAAEGV